MKNTLVLPQKTKFMLKIAKKKVKNQNNIKLKAQKQNKYDSTISEKELKKIIKQTVLKNENQVDYQIAIVKVVKTRDAKSIAYMFSNCLNLEYVNISVYDSKNINDMSYMFVECNNLRELVFNFNCIEYINNIGYMYEIEIKSFLYLVPFRGIHLYYKKAKNKSNNEREEQLKAYIKNKNELLVSEEEFL